MADSGSDQFESADEGFSDVDEDSMPPPSSVSTNNETVSKNHILSAEQDVSSTLKNLSLQECMLSSKSTSAEVKQTASLSNEPLSCSQSKPDDKIVIETGKTVVDKSEDVDSPKKVDIYFKKNIDHSQPTISSKEDISNPPAARLTSENEGSTKCKSNADLSSGSFLISSESELQPVSNLIPTSDRTDEFKACSRAPFVEKTNLERTAESPLSRNSERTGSQSLQKSCESNPAIKIGAESNVQQEELDEISKNDGWDVENNGKKDSELLLTQSTVKNSETSNLKPSTKDDFKEENIDEGWDDGWEVDDAFETTPKPVPFQSTSESTETVLNSKSATKSSAEKKDEREADSTSEKKSKSASVQSTCTSSESVFNSKSSPKSNLELENTGENSWDDGWEMEGFEAGSTKSGKIKTEAILGSSNRNASEDTGWNDGWDTEEVTVSPDSSKDHKPSSQVSSSRSKVTEKKNVPANEEKVAKESLSNEASKLSQQNQDGWFGWGVTNILSSATEGLSSITSNVTSAFETTIGAPDPTEILRAQKEVSQSEETVPSEAKPQEGGFADNLFSVSSWTKFVESTGSRVLTTGLDTLETIGKKTMEVIQEGDPGLKKKRAKLREFVSEPGKPVLSQVLREAKERAETSSRTNEAAFIESKVNFEILFDDFEGLVHLEALEMISKQCQIKLDSLALKFSGNEAKNFKETLQEVEELCELPEDDETNSKEAMADSSKFKLRIQEVLAQLDVGIQYDKLLQTNEIVESRLQKEYSNPLELHQIVISSLAEISAAAMQIFHRAAEMLVIKSKHSTIAETDSLMSFGKLVCSKLEITAEKFSSNLKKIDPSDTAKVSHISKEATNSTTYTLNACQLLVPILQYGAVV